MKKTTIIIFLASLLIFAQNSDVKAQCKQQMVYRCATEGKNAIYLRDFNTKLKKTKPDKESGTKWTVVLNAGTVYRFILCTPQGFEDKVVLTLYDSQNPEKTNPLNSTIKAKGSIFNFVCRKSGMYYVSIRFKKDKGDSKTCAVGILSYVGKNQ